MSKSIASINQWFKKAGVLIIKLRWGILVALVLVNIVAIIGIRNIQLSTSYDDWFLEDDPLVVANDKFEEIFGSQRYVALLLETDDVFAPEMLRTIQELGEELVEKVPYADDILSLTDFEFTQGTEDGVEIGNIVPEEIPNDPREIEEIRKLAFSKNYWVNRLFSDDSQEAWFMLRLQVFPEKQEDGTPTYMSIAQTVEKILNQEKYHDKGYTIKTTGLFIQYEQTRFFSKEGGKFISLAFLVAIVLLGISLQSIRDILVPLITTISSLLWVYGAMGWLNMTIDSIALTLPVYLGLAVSIGYSVHLFNFFRHHFYTTGKRNPSIIYALEHTGWPILFTAITTMGAMLSFAVVPVKIVQWMGLSCAATVLTVYLMVMTLTPVLLSFGKDRSPHPEYVKGRGTRLENSFSRLSEWILTHSTPILVVFGLLVFLFGIGLTRIYVNMDYTRTYGLKVPFVKRFNEISASKVGAYNSYNVMLDFQGKNRAKTPEILQKIDLLISEIEQFRIVKRTTSLLDIIKDMNQVMHSGDPDYYRIPDEQELISQLLLLYEMSGQEQENWVDYDYTTLRILVEITDFDTVEVENEFRHIEQRTRELFPDATFGMVGGVVQISVAQNYVAKGEIRSFLIALCVVGILMVLVFRSIKTGLIGMIPNIAPVVVVGGIMGYADIPIDMMTMMIIPMILGLAVDDTIHFITHSQMVFQQTGNYHTAIQDTFKTVGKSIFMTSFILIAAFAIYMTSVANLVFHLGMLVGAGVFSALLADYFVTPVLLHKTKQFGQDKRDTAQM